MSLLDKATIITTPTAHSNGTLHSVKGGEVADFDVVRGSAATRVNAEGLIEDISVLSGELVTNGDFSNGSTDWTLGSSWSVANGLSYTDGLSQDFISQNIGLTTGSKYTLSFDISNRVGADGCTVIFGGTTFSGNALNNGVQTFQATADGGIELRIYGFNGNTYNIDNISVVEVIDATNIPRIDYTTGEGVVLLEPQSTNLLTYSEDFSQWVTSSSTEIANNAISPNGGMNAYKLYPNSSGNYRNLTTGGRISGLNTFSIFAKAGELQHLVLIDYDGGGIGIDFNLSTGVATDVSTSGFDSFDMVDYGNGWYRCTATASDGFSYWILSDNGGVSVTANGTDGLYVWGAQTEALPYATSYIPTSGAIATRLADSVTGAGDATTFNSTEGVLYAEIAALANDGTARMINISDGTLDNRVEISLSNQDNFIRVVSIVNGIYNAAKLDISANVTDFNKIAFSYKENDFKAYLNGTNVFTDTSAIIFAANTLDTIDFSLPSTNSFNFFGKTKAVAVFNEALTDSELECLTKI